MSLYWSQSEGESWTKAETKDQREDEAQVSEPGYMESARRENTPSYGLQSLAQDLPPALDAHLKGVVDSAIETCRRGSQEHRLLASLCSEHYSEADFQEALSLLNAVSPGAVSRAAACAWLLGAAPLRPNHRVQAANALGMFLRDPARAYVMEGKNQVRSPLRRTVSVSGPLSIAAMAIMLYSWGTADFPDPDMISNLSILLMLVAGIFGLLTAVGFPVLLICQSMYNTENARGLRFLAAHALGRLGVPQGITPLSYACLDPDSPLQAMAGRSLQALLPTLTVEHYGRMGAATVPNLCALLLENAPISGESTSSHSKFCLQLIEALEKIGDSRAIPAVRQLAKRGLRGQLQEAIERVLPVLEMRHQREIERETLLRGAKPPATGANELLRPGTDQNQSRPEELLRPLK